MRAGPVQCCPVKTSLIARQRKKKKTNPVDGWAFLDLNEEVKREKKSKKGHDETSILVRSQKGKRPVIAKKRGLKHVAG